MKRLTPGLKQKFEYYLEHSKKFPDYNKNKKRILKAFEDDFKQGVIDFEANERRHKTMDTPKGYRTHPITSITMRHTTKDKLQDLRNDPRIPDDVRETWDSFFTAIVNEITTLLDSEEE